MQAIKRWIAGSISMIIMVLFALAGYDYIGQAEAQGQSLSDFGLSGWTQSFVDRGKSAARRAQLEVLRDGPLRDYFPPAPHGWVRLDWDEGYHRVMWGGSFEKTRTAARRSEQEAEALAEVLAPPIYSVFKTVDGAVVKAKDRANRNRGWVYARGEHLVILRARFFDPDPANSMFARAGVSRWDQRDTRKRRDMFTSHGGVAFYEMQTYGNPGAGVREFRAVLGGELEITVETNGPVPPVKEVLRKIRYKDLWALLTRGQGEEGLARQREQMAAVEREKREIREREAREMQAVREELDRKAWRARGSSRDEVCVRHKGKDYCQWVN